MVILKQTNVQRCLGKGKFAECWLILAHEQDGPAILIFKDHTAKKMVEDKIIVAQVAERMRFGTTTVTFGSCPETTKNDIKIHPSCYMAISTEKLIKKQPKPYIIWLCVNSMKELFSIVRLLSASLSCLQIPAPLAYTKDDTLALHNYVPISFKPRNEWEEYWDNPPMIMSDSPINLTLAQNSGLAKSYDQLEESGNGSGKPMKRKQQKEDEAKKKMYSSTPTLAEPIQAARAPRSTSQSSSTSSSTNSELDTAPAKPRRFKQRSKPQSIETISTFDFAENAKKPSRSSSHHDPNEWDVMYPTLDLPSRPLTAQRTTPRRYESPTEKRSKSAISSPSGTLPQRYSPKSIALQPSSTVSKSESFESDLDQPQHYYKDSYSPSILKRPAPVAPLSSPRSSPPLLQHHRSQILLEPNQIQEDAPLYEYLSQAHAPIPRKQSDSDKSLHSIHSIHSSHSLKSEKSVHRYDYPPIEKQPKSSGLQYTPFELVKQPLHAPPITSKPTTPRSTTPKFVTPIQSPIPPSTPPKQHPQTPPRKISPILAITPPTTPPKTSSPNPREISPPLIHVAPITHPAPTTSPQSDSPKPTPLPRVSRYSDAEVQTEHPIQMEPLIETPAHLFDTNVEKLKSLATAPIPDPDPLPAPPPKPVSIKDPHGTYHIDKPDKPSKKRESTAQRRKEETIEAPELLMEDQDNRVYTINTHF
uniref:Uncharacterized protein n=1 Tax=Panagrolaimus superbus TaxID=310955 RepID=A0A914ZBI9_9BILA